MATIVLTPVQTLALAAFGVFAGEQIRRRVPLLQRLSIPGSIAGGLLYSAGVLALHATGVDLNPDTTIRDVLMLAVFTIIGLNASVGIIARGGFLVILLVVAAGVGALLQNLLGMGVAHVFGLNPLVGILAGAVSLAGGPATSLAFGPTFERMGVEGATTIALASATFGIAVSGLLAGTVGGFLIRRFQLKPGPSAAKKEDAESRPGGLVSHVLLIAVAMGVGMLISTGIERSGVVLPGYIGAMTVAAIIRNIDDARGWFGVSDATLGQLFGAALPLFIVLAMLTLHLWEIAHLAGLVLVILVVQTVLTWMLSAFFVFPLMRRDFDAAIIATGYCGFMLGITANALATMEEVTGRFGSSPRAFVVVPMVGAFLIDFTNALLITAMANLLK